MNSCIMNQPLPQSEATLPQHFTPSNNHVIIGRGKKTYNHTGNIIFRDAIQSRLAEYSQAKTKQAKSAILIDIVQSVHSTGGFIKKNAATGQWMTAGTFLAREKVSQTIRDILSDNYKSSKASKKKRRQEQLLASTVSTTSDDSTTQQPPKRRRQNDETDFQLLPFHKTTPTTTVFSDGEFLSRLYTVVSPSLAEMEDTSSLEPTPLSEEEEETYDIDNVFESTVVVSDDDEEENNEMDSLLFGDATLAFDNQDWKKSSFQNFFEMADFFRKPNDLPKIRSYSVDFPDFLPLRNVASACTA